ncbi:MAG: hypothetical protein GPJ50_03870 [Candidatus Heimdallarchaeota archaeon]|nr:hypothetical protein [Candidatus Heimdallarchaeota archaeon]
MKFNVEVDLDYSNQESLEEDLINRVMTKISEKITQKIFTDVYINACQKIGIKVDTIIDEALIAFMNRQITITDKWGHEVEEYESVNEMLEKRFDDFMTGRVDNNGKTIKKGCSYHDQDSRIKYLIDKTAKYQIDKFINNITKIVDNRIQVLLKKTLQEELSDTMFKHIDVKKLLRGF